jgi:hypothetical protein
MPDFNAIKNSLVLLLESAGETGKRNREIRIIAIRVVVH